MVTVQNKFIMLKSVISPLHLFSVSRSFRLELSGISITDFISSSPSRFITVLTARIESPNRKELKMHKTFHSPTPDFLSRELGQIEI